MANGMAPFQVPTLNNNKVVSEKKIITVTERAWLDRTTHIGMDELEWLLGS
ncbi:hypothetical protein Sjap_024274 [Stephania japonica]|uniref:Uncharacterized protein n=1 Tax=Stephania japonica TaxID=461633 RepID=A0AAP0EHV7_9MAGN